MTEKLKPCPFCGGIPAIAGLITPAHKLEWRLKLGNGQHEDFPTQEAAHEAWNRRVKDGESKNSRQNSIDATEI